MNQTQPMWFEFRNALFERDYAQAESLLKATPSLTHLTDGLGETVLHFLAVENDQESVSWLRARGADPNTKNAFGTPVIFEVAQLGYRDLYLWFVGQGVDLKATNSGGQDIVAYLLEYDKEEMANWVRQHIGM